MESLQGYEHDIQALKKEMAEATEAAAAIRHDIRALSLRHVAVTPTTTCGVRRLLVRRKSIYVVSVLWYQVWHTFTGRCRGPSCKPPGERSAGLPLNCVLGI